MVGITIESTAGIGYDSIDMVTALGEVLRAVFDVVYLQYIYILQYHYSVLETVLTYVRTSYVSYVPQVSSLMVGL